MQLSLNLCIKWNKCKKTGVIFRMQFNGPSVKFYRAFQNHTVVDKVIL